MHMFVFVLSLTLYFPSDPFPNLTYFRVVFQRQQYAFIICSRIFQRYNISIISGRHSNDFSGGSVPCLVSVCSLVVQTFQTHLELRTGPISILRRFVRVVPRWFSIAVNYVSRLRSLCPRKAQVYSKMG